MKDFYPNLNMLIIMSVDSFLYVYGTAKDFKYTSVSYGKLQPKCIMPPFPNFPPKKAPLPIPHSGVLALTHPPKPSVQN